MPGIVEMELRKLREILDQIGPAIEADDPDSDGLTQAGRIEIAFEKAPDPLLLGVAFDEEDEPHNSASKTPDVKSFPRE
jgi:hypothetical protein